MKGRIFCLSSVLSFLAIPGVLLFATPARSQQCPLPAVQDCTLVIPGVPGESRVIPDGIEVKSFSFGVTNVGSATGGGGTGKARFSDLQITKATDKSSPVLFQNCAAGQHYPKATLFCRKAGGEQRAPFLSFELQNALTTSVKWSGSSDEGPQEQISFTYGEIKVTYQQQNKEGSIGDTVSRCWDVIKNQPCST